MIRRALLFSLFVSLLSIQAVLGHPHFRKALDVAGDNFEAKLNYFTYSYNPARLAEVAEGFVFSCGGAKLTITKGTLSSQGQTVTLGEYLLRARASSPGDWTLILIPITEGMDVRNPDMTKALQLESKTTSGHPEVSHLLLDLHGGSGATDGKLIISVAFGPRLVEGILDLPAPPGN